MSSGPASRLTGMETERVTASTTIEAAPEAVFAVLADPSAHAHIDGTGWVRQSLDDDRITAAGQVFRMAMYHENHPDKDYKIANRVEVFDEPRIVPASFDFCRANLNEPSSAGTSIPSDSLNPTARFFGSSSGYRTLIDSPLL